MVTPIYIKMDAPDQLLLSEGVCRQLGIVGYHESVGPWPSRLRSTRKENKLSVHSGVEGDGLSGVTAVEKTKSRDVLKQAQVRSSSLLTIWPEEQGLKRLERRRSRG